jgi:hypothetical protein
MRGALLSFFVLLALVSLVNAGPCVDQHGNTYFTNKECPQGTSSTESPSQAAQPRGDTLEFRGIYMGSSMDRVFNEIRRQDASLAKLRDLAPESALRKVICAYQNACEGIFEIKGVTVKVQFGFEGEILTRIKILFSPRNYEILRSALVDKYGKPTDTKSEILRTAMGVRANNESSSWLLSGGFISVHRYDGRIDEGSIAFLSSDYVARYMQKKEADKSAPGF